MKLEVKKYRDSVRNCLVKKYGVSEIIAEKIIQESYLYTSLLYYPNETIHDDIEMTADEVYNEYTHPQLLKM